MFYVANSNHELREGPPPMRLGSQVKVLHSREIARESHRENSRATFSLEKITVPQ